MSRKVPEPPPSCFLLSFSGGGSGGLRSRLYARRAHPQPGFGGMQARRVIAGRFQEKMPRTRGSRACTGRGILTLTIRLVSLLLSSTLQRSLILVRVPKPTFSSPRCVMNFALSRQAPQFLRCKSRFEEKGDDGWGKNIDGTDSEGYSWLGVTARSTHSGPTQPLRTR